MMNRVSIRKMQNENFRINTYEKVHLVGLFIQLKYISLSFRNAFHGHPALRVNYRQLGKSTSDVARAATWLLLLWSGWLTDK